MEVTVDMDALADKLGVTTRFLQKRIEDYGLVWLVNQAARKAHGEWFDSPEPKPMLPPTTVELRHLVDAAKQELDLS